MLTRPRHALLVAFLALGQIACGTADPVVDREHVRLTVIGRAHVENRESELAVSMLSKALELAPTSPGALRNLARAQLVARDPDAALATLARVREVQSESASTRYLTGIALLRADRAEEAIPHLTEAIRLDPMPAALHFQLAIAHQAAGQPTEAEARLRAAFERDPRHVSAAFRLARLTRARGDLGQAAEWDREFNRLRAVLGEGSRTNEELEACVHAEIEVPSRHDRVVRPFGVRFVDATSIALDASLSADIVAAAPFEVAENGNVSILVTMKDGSVAVLAWQAAGGMRRVQTWAGLADGTVRQMIVGDRGNGAPPGADVPAARAGSDAVLVGAGAPRLLSRSAARELEDVTIAAGLQGSRGVRATWIDHDHDGDLDLLLADGGGMTSWLNQGDGRFSEGRPEDGLVLHEPVLDMAAADLDADGAIDVVAALGGAGTVILAGRRGGRFERIPGAEGTLPAAHRVKADYIDEDTSLDLVLLRETEVEVRLRGLRRVIALAGMRATAMCLLDADNDGLLDVAVVGTSNSAEGLRTGVVRILRNIGSGKFADVTDLTDVERFGLPPLADVQAADVDGDGDSDLLAVAEAGGLHVLRNDSSHARRQVQVRLSGTKSNPQGVGSRVELVAGEYHAARWVTSPVIALGIGDAEAIDVVRTTWTTGVMDNAVALPVPRGPLDVQEKPVATGSCPFLHAWRDGGFAFVTDLLGAAPLGLPLARGQDMPVNPEEIVVIGGEDALSPLDGHFLLEVTNEFREVIYLDSIELLACDHRPDEEVHSTSSLTGPPFEPPRLRAVTGVRASSSVIGDDGVDRTADVSAIDGLFAPAGSPLPARFRGIVDTLSLGIEVGGHPAPMPDVLVLTGWLQYGDSSTNIALSQLAEPIVGLPRLWMEMENGNRALVPTRVGLPAGKTKTILVDLPEMPPTVQSLVLESAFEVRWDRIAMARDSAGAPRAPISLRPVDAELRFRGFSELVARGPGHPTTPGQEQVASRPPWHAALEGWSTRHGDVLELAESRDGRLVIINSGDALRLRFRAEDLPPVPPGMERTFALHVVGWVKDGDHNTAGGDRVEPLPGAEGDVPSDAAWRAQYNTRWMARDAFAR